ncbi:MAG: cobalamin-binding protein [Chlorobiaceae bacterium]|nr:cobalamin-binding protein [Chlorobiaceae bacterium]
MRSIFISERRVLPFFFLLLFLFGCNKVRPAGDTGHSAGLQGKPTVVSLAPSITEMMYAIGAGKQLVGRTSACDWPREASSVPVAGAFGRPSLEVLAAIHPDLVIDVDMADKETAEKIKSLGIRLETITCRQPDDIPHALRTLGSLTGHEAEAGKLAADIEKGLAEYRKAALSGKARKKVYLEIWDDPLWTGGKGSYTSSLIAYSGAENIGDTVDKEYFEVSEEWIISKNPDIIACMYMSKASSAVEKLAARQGWSTIRAVKDGRVYDHFDNNIFLRPGPRVLEGIRQMRRIIFLDEKHAI